MRKSEVLDLFDYNYWANKRLLDAARMVTPERFAAPGSFPYGGLRGTLVHVLDAEHSWRMLLEKGIIVEDIAETELPTLHDLEIRWHEEEAAMRSYVASLEDEALGGLVRYTASTGIQRERERWHCLFHVVNHGTQHRSEAAALLTGFERSPGDIDFTVFLNERRLPPAPTA